MQITQSYAQRSGATLDGGQFSLNVATEASRPAVKLHATIVDGLAYARVMKMLYAVVTSNHLTPKKDRSDYFAWVQQEYLNELGQQMAETAAQVPGWKERRAALKAQIAVVTQRFQGAVGAVNSTEFYGAQRNYYNYLYKHDHDMWYALDPVISVHRDCVIFEAFSQDESTYGRVTVPMSQMRLHGDVAYGTTNIDFSPDLAREIGRIRSYRATDLHVEPNQVALATVAGAAIEKKIDLPPTWVRGFLQVQSASSLPGTDVRLSAGTLADVLAVVARQREKVGPRSLRFILAPGQKPTLVVEPWGVRIVEAEHVYTRAAQEIRVWGRRRLLALKQILPYATDVRVRLLGTGMPSYWSVSAGDNRIDLGLSGWTQNDWAKAAQFDLLTSVHAPKPDDVQKVARVLEATLYGTPAEIGQRAGIGREAATSALQALCRDGLAMYDYVGGIYRWRKLFPFAIETSTTAEDPRLRAARRILERRGVTWSAPPAPTPAFNVAKAEPQWRTFVFKDDKSDKFWNIMVDGDRYTVRFGRSGTQGQTQEKEFDTAQEAKDTAVKLIREKTGKGYAETTPPATPADSTLTQPARDSVRYEADVRSEKLFAVVLDIDRDGRVAYAHCTCGEYRANKLRKGPCAHIISTTLQAMQHILSQD